jgi:hypothetical protein
MSLVFIAVSDAELVKVADAMFPYPVYSLSSFISKIAGIEVAT